jgi:hypothetical protein
MRIATVLACCAECGTTFSYPELDDFVYGTFVLTGERGTVFACLEALGHPVFELVRRVVDESDQAAAYETAGVEIAEICARLANPVESQNLVAHHVCPVCQSANWKSWDGDRTGLADIPDASYSDFLALPALEQRQRILGTAGAVASSLRDLTSR